MAKFEVGVHAVILNDEDAILLIHRRDMDLWDLPGGGMEPGEIPTEAVIRETKEETGLEVNVERLFLVATTPENVLGFTYFCHITGGEITTSDESNDVHFFRKTELPENLSPRKRAMLLFSMEKPTGITYRHVELASDSQWLQEGAQRKVPNEAGDMNVLIIGAGGREHAIAWKVAQSGELGSLYCLPGNPGTALLGGNVSGFSPEDFPALRRFCLGKKIGLVIVGPEQFLAAGLADKLTSAGIKVFGPSKAAARIESSKVFSKDFMRRWHIPTAGYEVFSSPEKALRNLQSVDHPVVIKASGLAAGKGVILPESLGEACDALDSIMIDKDFGEAGKQVVIEERLSGQEVSLLAFSDGVTVKPMLSSQDHKRVLEGDQGPNTGGMGAYAPVPFCPPEMVNELTHLALLPAVTGMREEGFPYVGVLYAGFMLTADGPRVIEFNCRFGDPETQVLLPLLKTDLLEVALACVEGRLDQVELNWKDAAAGCVVLASEGYPGKYVTGCEISGLEQEVPNTLVFHSGTKRMEGKTVTAGGRVLCVTGLASNTHRALDAAYARIGSIRFDGMHYRKDIGWRICEERQ